VVRGVFAREAHSGVRFFVGRGSRVAYKAPRHEHCLLVAVRSLSKVVSAVHHQESAAAMAVEDILL
jgi:hypothetical protein